MFASSYVEEEQHFWYWTSSAWLGWLFIRKYVLMMPNDFPILRFFSQRKSSSRSLLSAALSMLPLVCLRVASSWNQTGQKHAGAPDIARHILPYHSQILWALVFCTYAAIVYLMSKQTLPGTPRAIVTTGSISLAAASFAFKVAFTLADAPELLSGFEKAIPQVIKETSLITQARVVYILAFAFASVIFLSAYTSTLPWLVSRKRGTATSASSELRLS